MTKDIRDLLEVLTAQDGQFNEQISAYVTAYVFDESNVAFELEYVDTETEDFDIVKVTRFTVVVEEND